MSDVNFLAQRARLLGKQLSESWMASAGGLLDELADALEAAAKPAGEAVVAAGQAEQGVGGMYGTGAAPWGSPGLETDRNMAGRAPGLVGQRSVDTDKPCIRVGVDYGDGRDETVAVWSVDGKRWTEVPPATWTVPGRGAMTPQQMADALVETDRLAAERLRDLGAAWDRCEERRVELAERRQEGATNGKTIDAYRAEVGRLRQCLDVAEKEASNLRVGNFRLGNELDAAIMDRDAVTVELNQTKVKLDEARAEILLCGRAAADAIELLLKTSQR